MGQANSGVFDKGLKAAIYQGLFAPVQASDITSTCATENCTFPAFDSRAFCSTCKTFTNEVQIQVPKNGSGIFNWTVHHIPPVTAAVSYGDDGLYDGPAILVTPFATNLSEMTVGISSPLSSFSVFRFPQINGDWFHGWYATATPNAWACALYFCVNTYAANIMDNQMSSTLLSSWYNTTGTPIHYIEDPLSAEENYFSIQYLYLQPPSNTTTQHLNSTFWVPSEGVKNLAYYFNNFFNIELFAGVDDSGAGVSGPFLNDTVQPFTNQNFSVIVDEILQGMTTTMTNYIRTAGRSQNDLDRTVIGASYRLEPVVQVSCPWLALPSSLLVLSAAFFISTARLSRKAKQPIWKNSVLPALFHGPDEDVLNTAYVTSQTKSLDDMTQLVKSTRVTLMK